MDDYQDQKQQQARHPMHPLAEETGIERSNSRTGASSRPIISAPLESHVQAPQAEFAAATLFPRTEFPASALEDFEDFSRPDTPGGLDDNPFYNYHSSGLASPLSFNHYRNSYGEDHENSPAFSDTELPTGTFAPFRKTLAEDEEQPEGLPPELPTPDDEHENPLEAVERGRSIVNGLGIRTAAESQQRPATPFPAETTLNLFESPTITFHSQGSPLKIPDTPSSAGVRLLASRSRFNSKAADHAQDAEQAGPDALALHKMLSIRDIQQHRPRRDSLTSDPEVTALDLRFVRRLLRQLLKRDQVPHARAWEEHLSGILYRAAKSVRHDPRLAGDSMDVRTYIKIKKIPGGTPKDSEYVDGIVCSKNVLHKRMIRKKNNPRVMLLSMALEYQRPDSVHRPDASQLMSLEPILQQERDYLKKMVDRIVAQRPHIVLVEKNVSGLALEYLHNAKVAVARNVKPSVMQAVSRATQSDIIASMDRLAMEPRIGRCGLFRIQTFDHSAIPDRRKTIMRFEGCHRELGATILLRGGSLVTLRKIKNITKFMLLVASNLRLESTLFHDEHVSLSNDPLNVLSPAGRMTSRDQLRVNQLELPSEGQELSKIIRKTVQPFKSNIISISPFTMIPPPHAFVQMEEEDAHLSALRQQRTDEEAEDILLSETVSQRSTTSIENGETLSSVPSSATSLSESCLNSLSSSTSSTASTAFDDQVLPPSGIARTLSEHSILSTLPKSQDALGMLQKNPAKAVHSLAEISAQLEVAEDRHAEVLNVRSLSQMDYIANLT